MIHHLFSKIDIFVLVLLLSCLPLLSLPPAVYADGGAPNLAYVAGAGPGVSVIDVAQLKVTRTINASGKPATILLSTDARFLYVTQPQENRVAILGAKDGNIICTADVPGQPTLLALDTASNNNTIYAAGNASATVTAIDATNCTIKRTYHVNGAVYGLAVANVGTGLSGSSNDQLWVADQTALNIFDATNSNKLSSIDITGGPEYVLIPPGATVYTTTRQGSVDAISLNSHQITPIISGGSYGPMDYDATTGEVFVPDKPNNQVVVLTPVNAGFALPKEPNRILHLQSSPQAIAITSDGQLGFAALNNGDVIMLDIPGRQQVDTIHVGGSPSFVITGVYPPALGTTPQQASIYSTIINIAAYGLVIALFIVPILLFRRYAKTNSSGDRRTS